MRQITAVFLVVLILIGTGGCATTLLVGGATALNVAHDRRTTATQLADQTIEFKGMNAFTQISPDIGQSHVNVTSYNHVVLLSGEVESDAIKQWAGDVMHAIDGVRFVHNELTVAPATPWTSRSNDAWLTTKAKTNLLGIETTPGSFDATRVKVVTERGVVYLLGLVTPREADEATESIRKITGVQQVVKMFEYIEPAT